MKTCLLVCLGILFLTSACGGEKSKTYTTPEGKVKVSQEKNGPIREMKITTQKGTTTMKMGAATLPKDLGVPIYPGMKPAEGGTFSMSGTGKEGNRNFASYRFATRDSIDDVSTFYHKKLDKLNPKTFEMNMPAGRTTSFSLEQKETALNIVLTENKDTGGTNIQIMKTGK